MNPVIAYTINRLGGRTRRYSSLENLAAAYGLQINNEGDLFSAGGYVGYAELV